MEAAAEAAAATTAEKRVLVLSRVASPAARGTAERVGWDIRDHNDIVRVLQQEVSPESARVLKLRLFATCWKRRRLFGFLRAYA